MSRFTCPCGRVYLIMEEKEKQGILSRLRGQSKGEFEASAPWQAAAAQPQARPHDPVMTRHVRLPLVQSLICGFFAALVPVAIAATAVVLTDGGGWWWAVVPATFVVAGLGLSGVTWYILFAMNTKTLLLIERFVGIDLNRDGVIGSPPAKPSETTVRLVDENKRQTKRVTLPVGDAAMTEIARAMLQSGDRYNFSRRDMRAKTAISDDQFEKLQRKFLEHGWAVYRAKDKPNSGVVLLAAGRAVLRGYL